MHLAFVSNMRFGVMMHKWVCGIENRGIFYVSSHLIESHPLSFSLRYYLSLTGGIIKYTYVIIIIIYFLMRYEIYEIYTLSDRVILHKSLSQTFLRFISSSILDETNHLNHIILYGIYNVILKFTISDTFNWEIPSLQITDLCYNLLCDIIGGLYMLSKLNPFTTIWYYFDYPTHDRVSRCINGFRLLGCKLGMIST